MTEDAPYASAQPTEDTPAVILPENSPGTSAPVPSSGKRSAFRDIRRQLSEEELKQTGVQKLIIEDFERAEAECEMLRGYIERYHEKDKEAATLSEKLRTNRAFEIVTGATLAAGGAILSLVFLFTDPKDSAKFYASLG